MANLPTETPTVKMERTEVPPRVAVIPHAVVLNKSQNHKPAEEKCTWGLHCPICKKEEEGMEDWNGDRQESQQRNHYPQNPQQPKPMTFLIGFLSRSSWRQNGMRRWNVLTKSIT